MRAQRQLRGLGCFALAHLGYRQQLSALVLACSCCEPFVSEPRPRNRVHERIEPLERVPCNVAVVQTEGKLVNVTTEMLLANLVVDAVQPALEDRPDTFDTVRAGLAAHIFVRRMVDALLFEEQAVQVIVRAMLIGKESRADFDVAVNGVLDFFHRYALERESFCATATFPHSKYRSFTNRAASESLLVGFVLITLQTADESLVDLHRAAQFVQVFATRFAETVKNEPSGFLSDSDFLRQLHRRNALSSRNEQVHGIEPLLQRYMRPLEDSSCPHGEIQFADVAAIVAVFTDGDSLSTFAVRAGDSVRPETAFEIH